MRTRVSTSDWGFGILAGMLATTALAAATHAGVGAPQLVKDINPGLGDSFGSFAGPFVPFAGALYFVADDGQHGIELWRTDATTDGTQLVIDLNRGAQNALPAAITPVNGSLYFTAYDTAQAVGSNVFKSDGTAAGTSLLIDTFPGMVGPPSGPPLPQSFTAYGDNVLFTATDSETGNELWMTDGTTANTHRIIDLHPGVQWSVPVALTPFNGKVYFAADDKFTADPPGSPLGYFDRELFMTDGTAPGTTRVKDIFPGPRPSIPFNLTVLNGKLLFSANDGTNGTELWTSDGTEAGTTLMKDINPLDHAFPMQFAVVGSRLFLNADDGIHGAELWLTDGTESGTRMVKDINAAGGSLPLGLTPVGDRVFFAADDGEHGIELWVSDGTETGTHLVKDLDGGPGRSSPLELVAIGDKIFFTAIRPDDARGTVKTQLWMTDGTELGTEMVFEEPGVSFGYAIRHLTVLGHMLLFTAPIDVDANGMSINTELYSIVVPG